MRGSREYSRSRSSQFQFCEALLLLFDTFVVRNNGDELTVLRSLANFGSAAVSDLKPSSERKKSLN